LRAKSTAQVLKPFGVRRFLNLILVPLHPLLVQRPSRLLINALERLQSRERFSKQVELRNVQIFEISK
jgi:hypothetical protein